jgi:UPF0755 protein
VTGRNDEAHVAERTDPHDLLFGGDDDDFAAAHTGRQAALPPPPGRAGRHSAATRAHRRRRGRRLLWVLVVLGVLVVAVSAWVVVPKVSDLMNPPDYSGNGSGSVQVTVTDGDTASDIAQELHSAGVVKSNRAFVDAASSNPASQNLQPGRYTLHKHMSAASALRLLLSPSARVASDDVLVTEGATVFGVARRLRTVLGRGAGPAITKALARPVSVGVPLGYAPEHGKLSTVEGFLFPATYSIDPKASAGDALAKMTSRFAAADRSIHFAADAKKMGMTPYRALTIASIIQAEAKFPADMAKVARVILNRLKAHNPLKIDATTRYGARISGKNPDKVDYARFVSPYNTYLHAGLPPSPISNPGTAAMKAAVHPAGGDWLYYVNADAAGHLFFTSDQKAFARAAAKCHAHHWGCG